MIKRMLIMLLAVGLLFGGIFGYQAFKAQMMKKAMSSNQAPPVTVSTMKAGFSNWQPLLKAVGTLRAERGVDVTTEIAGLVRSVHFESGDDVKEGQILVQLNADSDIAQLHALQAAAELARLTYERDSQQFAARTISKAALDADTADLKSKKAQVEQQSAIIEKKTIRAPFPGRLGISTVNPGQYLTPGEKIVTLQSLDTIFADFYLPQQELDTIAPGQKIMATTDTYPDQTFEGTITAINPSVDPATRNVQVEATIPNPGHRLLPGMFASIDIQAGKEKRFLTLPQTVVTYNPYGDTVYVVEEKGQGADGKPALAVKSTFVTTGDTRGDQVAILDGIKEGDTVVTSGQLKLRNGSRIIINNKVQPSNDAAPKPADQ